MIEKPNAKFQELVARPCEIFLIYINGDRNLPSVPTRTAAEGGATRVLGPRQIEPEFLSRMFAAVNAR